METTNIIHEAQDKENVLLSCIESVASALTNRGVGVVRDCTPDKKLFFFSKQRFSAENDAMRKFQNELATLIAESLKEKNNSVTSVEVTLPNEFSNFCYVEVPMPTPAKD